MPRYAPKMTESDLRAVLATIAIQLDYEEDFDTVLDLANVSDDQVENIIASGMHEEHGLFNTVFNDWSKIEFDLENVMYEETYVTDTGVPVVLMACGGDWEAPLIACVYYDGKKLRGYVPKDGNIYCLKTKRAFGNDEPGEAEEYTKRFGKDPEEHGYHDVMPDMEKVRKDINARIVARGEYVFNEDRPESPAKKLAEEQKAKEADIDLSGDITPDMVRAVYNLAAGGCYVEFRLKASDRQLTKGEAMRVTNLPPSFTTYPDVDPWYAPQGVYPARAEQMLKPRGFETHPDSAYALRQQPTCIVYLR